MFEKVFYYSRIIGGGAGGSIVSFLRQKLKENTDEKV
jgi:galactokinase